VCTRSGIESVAGFHICIYAKPLLSGAAKIFFRSQRDVRQWRSSKSELFDEFGGRVSSADVHRRLGK